MNCRTGGNLVISKFLLGGKDLAINLVILIVKKHIQVGWPSGVIVFRFAFEFVCVSLFFITFFVLGCSWL